MSVIKVTNAHKEYHSKLESKVVLRDFNMNVEEGAIYAMMGSSGSGKTTLISCLVGILNLDSGNIEIFGEGTRENKRRIGYMPQDHALINAFTVSEMIWFFGKIFSLKTETIKTRFKFLTELLELPVNNQLIEGCSGGEKRRISLALTLVHEPQLLILDEPTVGLDALLRNKIWDYFIEITETRNVTVLLSTHYIEEARRSTTVGLMRKGVQIAEDSPENILRFTERASLEEAFLRFSEIQEDHSLPKLFSKPSSVETVSVEPVLLQPTTKTFKAPKDTEVLADWRIFVAILMKNFIQLRRNLFLFLIISILPIILCCCFNYAIGGNFQGLSLGVVNNEVMSIDECFDRSLITVEIQQFRCTFHKLSCRFINVFDDSVANKTYFETFDDAYKALKKGKIIGFIQFSSNFTKSFNDRSIMRFIEVYLDESSFQIAIMIKRKLFEAYANFNQQLRTDCGKSRITGNPLGGRFMKIEAAHGDIDSDFRGTIVPAFLLLASFSMATYITLTSIFAGKVDGTWDRTIVAGVSPVQYLWAIFLEGTCLMLLQSFEMYIYVVFFLSPSMTCNSYILVAILLMLTGLAGLSFGLLISVLSNSSLQAITAVQFFYFPATFLSGATWPIEGLPLMLKYFGYILPPAIPTIALRNILTKDSTMADRSVIRAFIHQSMWIIVPLFLCNWLIRKNCDNKSKTRKQK